MQAGVIIRTAIRCRSIWAVFSRGPYFCLAVVRMTRGSQGRSFVCFLLAYFGQVFLPVPLMAFGLSPPRRLYFPIIVEPGHGCGRALALLAAGQRPKNAGPRRVLQVSQQAAGSAEGLQ